MEIKYKYLGTIPKEQVSAILDITNEVNIDNFALTFIPSSPLVCIFGDCNKEEYINPENKVNVEIFRQKYTNTQPLYGDNGIVVFYIKMAKTPLISKTFFLKTIENIKDFLLNYDDTVYRTNFHILNKSGQIFAGETIEFENCIVFRGLISINPNLDIMRQLNLKCDTCLINSTYGKLESGNPYDIASELVKIIPNTKLDNIEINDNEFLGLQDYISKAKINSEGTV